MNAKPIVPLKQWNKFSVSAGSTTRHFPLFLQRTADLSEASNQGKLKELWKNTDFVFLNQFHGGNVAVLEKDGSFKKEAFLRIPEADGILTNIPKTALLVLTADCLSIFFCAIKDGKASWIGLVHAGWRGAEAKIAQKAFILLMQKARCPAKDIRIVFGPSIGVKHYEVGEEFKWIFPESSLFIKEGKLHFDLTGENKRQLLEAGAHSRNIDDCKKDTFSDKDLYSFRREKDNAGRMISFIMKC